MGGQDLAWTQPLTKNKEIDDLVEEWTPEPLVGKTTAFEEAELERRPVIVGSACVLLPWLK